MSNNWNGKGLPPIGTKVMTNFPQARHKSAMQAHGKEAKIVAHADEVAIFEYDHEGCKYYHGFYEGHFLPIKSDRDKAIEELVGLWDMAWGNPNIISIEEAFGILYDAGYRKTNSGE